jgi:hypothetical protein
MAENDLAKVVGSDWVPFFGAARYRSRNGLQEYHKSPPGDPSMNESAATKLLGLYLYSTAVLAIGPTALTFAGLAITDYLSK